MLSYRQPFREFRMMPVPAPEKPVRTLKSALIVDDHPLFCDALAMTLTGPVGIPDVEAVGALEARGVEVDERLAADVERRLPVQRKRIFEVRAKAPPGAVHALAA